MAAAGRGARLRISASSASLREGCPPAVVVGELCHGDAPGRAQGFIPVAQKDRTLHEDAWRDAQGRLDALAKEGFRLYDVAVGVDRGFVHAFRALLHRVNRWEATAGMAMMSTARAPGAGAARAALDAFEADRRV